MHNPFRSEHSLVLDGRRTRLVMNLGALAALEASLEEEGLAKLVERFAHEKCGAMDIIHVLNAGLYGAGEVADIENKVVEGGAFEAARVAMELMTYALDEIK